MNLCIMDNMNSEISFSFKTPFPLTGEIFDAFITLEQYTLNAYESETKKPVSDGLILYNIVAGKLREKGVAFSSPGNSTKRNFILWFNAHFIKDEPCPHEIEIKKKYFDLTRDIVTQIHSESELIISIKKKISEGYNLKIEGENRLTENGKYFMDTLFKK